MVIDVGCNSGTMTAKYTHARVKSLLLVSLMLLMTLTGVLYEFNDSKNDQNSVLNEFMDPLSSSHNGSDTNFTETMTRIMMFPPNAEVTGMHIDANGNFFVNAMHPDEDIY